MWREKGSLTVRVKDRQEKKLGGGVGWGGRGRQRNPPHVDSALKREAL